MDKPIVLQYKITITDKVASNVVRESLLLCVIENIPEECAALREVVLVSCLVPRHVSTSLVNVPFR